MAARDGQTRVDVWLPDDLRQRAEQAAADDHRSLSNFVRLAVEAACIKAAAANQPSSRMMPSVTVDDGGSTESA